jgi:hypothetical protein
MDWVRLAEASGLGESGGRVDGGTAHGSSLGGEKGGAGWRACYLFVVINAIILVVIPMQSWWWCGILGVNQTGRRAAAYSMPNPPISQRQTTHPHGPTATANVSSLPSTCQNSRLVGVVRRIVYTITVLVQVQSADKSLVSLYHSSPVSDHRLPRWSASLTVSTRPRHGLPYPSSRA